MPRTVQPSSSTRKSARHSGDASAPSSKSKVDREKMAFNLLHDQVLEGSFKAIKDPKNVMSLVWIREGKDMEEDEEGVDWIRQDGFTVAKYQQFWDLEMADEDEAIVEWAPKLPPVAKAHVSEEALLERWPQGHDGEEEEEEEVVEVAKVSPDNKRKSAKKSAKQPAKKRKTAKAVADTDDDLRGPLIKLRDEWFALLNAGGHQFFTMEKAKKSDDIDKMWERADRAIEAFNLNLGNSLEAKKFRKEKLDPFVKCIRAAVHAQVAKEAMGLMKQFFESFRLMGYVTASDAEADEGSASEGEATKNDATTDEEGAADEEVAGINEKTLSDAAADDLVEDVLA